jgi:hypothetical protein
MSQKSKSPGDCDAEALKILHERDLNSQELPTAQPERTQYLVALVALPGTNGPRALRHFLKRALSYGLRATSVEQVRP